MPLDEAGRAGSHTLDLSQVDVFRTLDLRGLPRRLALAVTVNSLREMERGALLCALLADAASETEFSELPGASPAISLVTRQRAGGGHLHILRRRLA